MPTIVIAHTFCASPDRRCLLIQGQFCSVQNYAEKAELSKCSWYPKRKSEIAMHFSEIIKLQFRKQRHTLLCILKLFPNKLWLINYLRKMRGYPQFSFWISILLVKICFSRIFSKHRKNTFELAGTVLGSRCNARVSRNHAKMRHPGLEFNWLCSLTNQNAWFVSSHLVFLH